MSASFITAIPKTGMRLCTCTALLSLAACGTPTPADYGSAWKPVHTYTAKVEKTPLVVAHVYSAHPSDATLRGLLLRWGSEAGAAISYASAYDFSLTGDVGSIQSESLKDAVAALAAIYREHGVEIKMLDSPLGISVQDVPHKAAAAPAERTKRRRTNRAIPPKREEELPQTVLPPLEQDRKAGIRKTVPFSTR